ncbi:hypothetical protein VSS74_06490, partial [Conexibacter stalactiti]|nr:hypothetical protein [Conexibacter stalactiti]MEC5034615.1 hypothetical protein [Conexibacter stalactiti]
MTAPAVPGGESAATPAEGPGASEATAPTKRFIGATAEQAGLPPVDAAPAAGETAAAPAPGDAAASAATAGETTAFTPVEQPTALFPLAEQPTEAQPALAPDAATPLSAAEAGSEPQSVAVIPGQQQLPGTDVATTSEQPAGAAGDAARAGDAGAEGATPATAESAPEQPVERRPGFRERGRMRRRLRYLRRLRELQVRDLGGLAFDLRRFERKRDDLVAQKVDQIRACDDELHALETALEERRDVRDVRLPGIGGSCPRCFSIYGSSDRFCAHCGAALGGLAQGPAQVAAPLAPPAAPAAPLPGGSAPP